MKQRLVEVEARKRDRWHGGQAVVPLGRDSCPECGGDVDHLTVGQLPLIRHGGYGAMKRTTIRRCPCGWRVVVAVDEVRPG